MFKSEAYVSWPTRLPSEVARDVAELAKRTQLESREKVFNEVRVFIEDVKGNPDPHVMCIVAEWGEGKTSIYEGYLKSLHPKEGKVITIGGSTLMNYAKKIVEEDLLPVCKVDGYRFLAAVFCSLGDELKWNFEGIKIPSPYRYIDARKYVLEVFKRIFGFRERKWSRLFIFIDEFEEIVRVDPETRNMLVSGIVDFLNMKVSELGEGGEYRGLLHLISVSYTHLTLPTN